MSDVTEGYASFSHTKLDTPAKTWYQVHGDLNKSSTGRPLILLHGGPGMTHWYITPMVELHKKHGITVVFYDQIGCGASTHYKEKRLDKSFWTVDLFFDELENLVKHLGIKEFDLLGQSWGGMAIANYQVERQNPNVKHLIISNSPASMKLWVDSCNEWRAMLPKQVEDTIAKYEASKEYDNPDYQNAVNEFYKLHLCRKRGEDGNDFPLPIRQTLECLGQDDTVYFTMNGPSEFTVIGSLTGWTLVGRLDTIKVPTLIINGEYDEARALCVKPYADEIKGSVWKTFEDTSHCSHIEKTDEYCQYVADWMLKN